MHIKQYRQWRHNGIAYEFGDQTYSEPNRTMMTYTEGFIKKGKEKGLKKEVGVSVLRFGVSAGMYTHFASESCV